MALDSAPISKMVWFRLVKQHLGWLVLEKAGLLNSPSLILIAVNRRALPASSTRRTSLRGRPSNSCFIESFLHTLSTTAPLIYSLTSKTKITSSSNGQGDF